MSSLCEIWQFIRAIDNQEPALVAIIKAILCAQFQEYLHKCVYCWWGYEYDEEDEMKPFGFPEMIPSKKNLIFLLDIGVSVNFYTRKILPIHFAAENCYSELVQILIKYGANVKLPVRPMTKEEIEQDKKDESCEYHSSRRWHQINNGSTALHLILRDCKKEFIDYYNEHEHEYGNPYMREILDKYPSVIGDNERGHACMKAILDKDPSVIHIKNAHELTPWDIVKDSKTHTKMKSIMEEYME